MKRKWFNMKGLVFSLLISGIGSAQQKYEMSAKEAVDIAFKNVSSIKNAQLDYKIAEARNREITAAALPQVSGTIQGNHYLSLPLIQFPDATEVTIYDVLKREGVKDAGGQPITKDGQFVVQNFSFFQPWNVNMGVQVQQLLFEPQVFVGLLARRALLESSGLQIKAEEDKVREAVYKSYYAVLITEKQLWFVEESLKRLEKLAHDMDVMYKNGFVEKLDIDKTTVTLNNTRTAANQLKNGITIGYAALKMTLGLQQADTLVLKDLLTSGQIKEGILDDNFAYENRNEIKLLNKAKELQGYDIRRYKLSYIPTLAAFYGFQENGQRKAGSGGEGSPWFWYNTNQIGLSINIPIFDGNAKRYKIQQAKFNLQKVENSIDMIKKGIDLERNVAKSTLTNAILNMDMQEDNMKLAEKVYNAEKKKYEIGTGSSFSILQADTDLQQAQSNYFRSLYDAIIAKVSYLKALGKL
ncbi:MAG: TolC family protein [Sphingobacteriales bacterium]|nr:TolC family protein [Sphingobacteriales bacterium]